MKSLTKQRIVAGGLVAAYLLWAWRRVKRDQAAKNGVGVIPGYRKAQKIKIENTQYDRRQKLSDADKRKMRQLRAQFGYSYQQLADIFGVSKSLAILTCRPDIYERKKEQFKARRADGRYKPTKEEWAETMREHRNYKAGLYFQGKIK